MRARKSKVPAPAEAGLTPIAVFEPGRDGIRTRQFSMGYVVVTIRPADSPDDDAAAADLAERLHLVCAIPPAPPRDVPWGAGQFNHVELGPGVRAALRITPDGRVKMTIIGGDLDVTDGSDRLGLGLLEAGARAAQRRLQLKDSERKRQERAAKRAPKRGQQ